MIVTQDLVNEIVRRAKASAVGLHQEPMTSLRITQYEEPCIESLAMMLVSAWEEKYDLVSVFSAAMSVIQEKAANSEIRQAGPETHDKQKRRNPALPASNG